MSPLAWVILPFLSFLTVNVSAATAGCGKFQWFPGVTQYKSLVTSKTGIERDYNVHLPWFYDSNHAYPVVLGFHGSNGVGFFFEADTKLSQGRFSEDKIMIYPTALNGSWAGPSYASTSMEAELEFIDDLVKTISEDFCVDEKKIYATGISNGGGFVGSLACDDVVGGKFAAFATAAGAFYTDLGADSGCKPARDVVPIISFHGGSDESVSYEGGAGSGGPLPTITSWLSTWSSRNKCSNPTVEHSHDNLVHHSTWSCGSSPALEHYKVDDMKHVWPDTEINFSQIAAGDKTTYIQASQLLMDFFDKFSLP